MTDQEKTAVFVDRIFFGKRPLSARTSEHVFDPFSNLDDAFALLDGVVSGVILTDEGFPMRTLWHAELVDAKCSAKADTPARAIAEAVYLAVKD